MSLLYNVCDVWRDGTSVFVIIQEGTKFQPFADVITKAATFPQLFYGPEWWPGPVL